MKFFLNINNKERVYVQQRDLAMLLPFIKRVPESIKQIHDGPMVIDLTKYVCFDKPEDIDFFKKQDWIVDFNEIKDLNSDKVVEHHKIISKQIKKLLDGEYTKEARNRVHLLEHKFNTYTMILWADFSPAKMKLPLIPNLNSDIYLEDITYIAYSDLMESSIIIFRKDGQCVNESDLESKFVSEIIQKQNSAPKVGFELQAKLLNDRDFIAISEVALKKENSFYNRVRSLIKKKY